MSTPTRPLETPVYFSHRTPSSTPQLSYASPRVPCSTPVMESWEDTYRVNANEGPAGGKEKEKAGKGLKKLLTFQWKKSPLVSARSISGPTSPILVQSSSPLSPTFPLTATPASRPAPPQKALPSFPGHSLQHGSPPKPHAATSAIGPHPLNASTSDASMSTHPSSSSFASTALFSDDWDSSASSDATTLSLTNSSPESSPHHRRKTSGESLQTRMWKVKGLTDAPLRTTILGSSSDEDVQEVIVRSKSSSRNSTPVPSMVAAMLKDPETPPRVKRLSASSKPAPESPPFDPLAHRRHTNNSLEESPESAGDADDEVSPKRGVPAAKRRDSASTSYEYLFPSDQVYSSRTRIPSIRFEGISMDAVFAEVERKMKTGGEASSPMTKAERRRTRVLSMYRPEVREEPDAPSPRSTTFPSHAPAESYEVLRSTSTTPTPKDPTPLPTQPLDVARPRPRHLPRRISSRPSPLNVAAANAFPHLRAENMSPSALSPRSPPLIAIGSPHSPVSPSLSAGPSTPRPNQATSPHLASPTFVLGEAFSTSPALSSASTFCGFDLPEVCVRPPTPTQADDDWVKPIDQRTISGPTKVVVVEAKRRIKISSRPTSSPRRRERSSPEVVQARTPPLSPAFSTTSSMGSIPSPLDSPVDLRSLSPSKSKHSSMALSVGSSGESDVEDALNNMLVQLNRPHTPPSAQLPPTPPPESTLSTSLTQSALALHTSSAEGLSLLDRAIGPGSVPVSVFGDSDGHSMLEGTEKIAETSLQARSVQGLGLEPSLFTEMVNEEQTTTPLHPPNQIFVTPATPIHSPPTSQRTSLASFDSSLSSSPEQSSRHPRRGDPFAFDSTDSETDGDESIDGAEVGVVMMGERVSCGYDIGMAM